MGKQFMKKITVKYTNKPIGDVKIIKDFLPNPVEIVLKEKIAKKMSDLDKTQN